MKRILGAIVVAAVLLAAGVAVACDGPWYGAGHDHMGQYRGDSPAAMKTFQKETSALRESLADKQIDLGVEYDKAVPDPARIASIRKDIVDLETKIQAAADKHGVRHGGWGRGSWAGGHGDRGDCGCW